MINLIKKIFGDTPYISEIDKFITNVDKRYPKKSASQLEEIKKYNRVFYLRDNISVAEELNNIWHNF